MPKRKPKSDAAKEKHRERKRAENQRYYAQTAWMYPRHRWTEEEEKMVMEHSMPDRELSDKIGRSMKSIQEKRRRMKREMEAAELESEVNV